MSIENPRFPFPRVYWDYRPDPKLKPDTSGLDPGVQNPTDIRRKDGLPAEGVKRTKVRQ